MNNADDLKVDMSKGFIVCGLSSGANFAMALTLRTRSNPLYEAVITGQLLQFPPVWNSGAGEYVGE